MVPLSPQILIVDDDPDVLIFVATLLEETGYRVARAANGEIALLLMKEMSKEGVAFDLIVTDVVLPGMWDGFSLAHRARELSPNIAVIYATGFADVARVRSRGAIFGEVLTKPYRSDDFLRAVRTALRAKAPSDAGLSPSH